MGCGASQNYRIVEANSDSGTTTDPTRTISNTSVGLRVLHYNMYSTSHFNNPVKHLGVAETMQQQSHNLGEAEATGLRQKFFSEDRRDEQFHEVYTTRFETATGGAADLILLQEASERSFHDHLSRLGSEYSGTLNLKPTPGSDSGTAILFRRSSFEGMEFKKLDLNCVATHAPFQSLVTSTFLGRAASKNNTAILFSATHVRSSRKVCGATVHACNAGKDADLKAFQALYVLHELSDWKPDITSKILSGDFNSVPGSACLTLLRYGKVSGKHTDFLDKENGGPLVESPFAGSQGNDVMLVSPLAALKSVYEERYGHEPFFTTYIKKGGGKGVPWFATSFAETIDYILFAGDLTLHSGHVGELITQPAGLENIFTSTRFEGPLPIWGEDKSMVALAEEYFLPRGCPNWEQPSDHFPLLAVFN